MTRARLRGQSASARRARLILDPPRDGLTNMAADETLFALAAESPYHVTLRIYGWSRPTCSLGRRQKFTEIDMDGCRRRGIDVVKRIGGGGAVYHDMEITYCLVTRIGESGLADCASAKVWRELFCSFLNRLGTRADAAPRLIGGKAIKGAICFAAANGDEPTVNGRKWVGSARRKNGRSFMQHGSILLERQPAFLAELMPCSRPDISTGLAEFAPDLDYDKVIKLFVVSIEETFHLNFCHDDYSAEEKALIEKAAKLKIRESLPAAPSVQSVINR